MENEIGISSNTVIVHLAFEASLNFFLFKIIKGN